MTTTTNADDQALLDCCRRELFTAVVGDVMVESGDLVFGDLDGVCVVPRAIERDVLARALEKAQGEKRVFAAIKDGLGAQAA